jgi:adenylate cyclase
MNKEEIQTLFKKEIAKEVFNNEIIRLNILFYVFIFNCFIFFLFPILNLKTFVFIFTEKMPIFLPSFFFGSIAIYFRLIIFVIKKESKQDKKVPVFPRYLNAFIEVSLPTIFMMILTTIRSDTALYILLTPPIQVYFIFIIASALRLSFKLSVFTGLVAGIEYFILTNYLFYINTTLPTHSVEFLISYPGFILRSLFLIASGVLIGYISSQIEKRLLNGFKLLNERNVITNLFGQHVSPEVVEKLMEQKDFTSEIKHVCILFLDIRNFTSFSESKSPDQVVDYLNRIFNFSIEIVNEYNGIINKFLGDGFMAVFGAPISNGNDVKNAVDCSLKIIQKIKESVDKKELYPTKIGIGLHTGSALTGNIGSSTRKEYTIIGDVVNLASRIEQLNKTYESELLISEEVNQFLDDSYAKEFLGEVTVKGRQGAVKIYKLV